MLRVRLFGGLALESEGVALPMPERRRACSLLGWLALHPGMHARSEIAGRFWPEVLESSARKSLRTELVAVRRALPAAGEGVLVATRDMVGLAGGDGVFVDAPGFDPRRWNWRAAMARSWTPGNSPGSFEMGGCRRPSTSATASCWRDSMTSGSTSPASFT